jgi:hypothetical protein
MTTLTARVRPGGADLARIRAALQAPGGASAPGLAVLAGLPESAVYAELDAGTDAGDVDRIGPDPIARAGRYRSTAPTSSVPALLAAAITVLADRGFVAGDYVDDATGRVDLLGALRFAAGVHPRDMPEDPVVLYALLDAEDAVAAELGADPTRTDAGERISRWTDAPGRTQADVVDLLEHALDGVTR